MAWRPGRYLIDGEIDNRQPGKVTGWLRFAGVEENVTLDLAGDFDRGIRGSRIRLSNRLCLDDCSADVYMAAFATRQTGQVGQMTIGRPPRGSLHLAWHSQENGQVLLELAHHRVAVVGGPTCSRLQDPAPAGPDLPRSLSLKEPMES